MATSWKSIAVALTERSLIFGNNQNEDGTITASLQGYTTLSLDDARALREALGYSEQGLTWMEDSNGERETVEGDAEGPTAEAEPAEGESVHA